MHLVSQSRSAGLPPGAGMKWVVCGLCGTGAGAGTNRAIRNLLEASVVKEVDGGAGPCGWAAKDKIGITLACGALRCRRLVLKTQRILGTACHGRTKSADRGCAGGYGIGNPPPWCAHVESVSRTCVAAKMGTEGC
ncbi:hypothetical protein LY76DRAFT_42095 [Colletotrichum caudatum]|nr:hypothetical protein LY76DRAFT_42095 [Colletotrichum caudatum]